MFFTLPNIYERQAKRKEIGVPQKKIAGFPRTECDNREKKNGSKVNNREKAKHGLQEGKRQSGGGESEWEAT